MHCVGVINSSQNIVMSMSSFLCFMNAHSDIVIKLASQLNLWDIDEVFLNVISVLSVMY